jgi:hypothetical protein
VPIDLEIIDQITGRRCGVLDVPCLFCGPTKHSVRKQRKPVLRVWRDEPDFATYFCARCGEHGFARSDGASAPRDSARFAKVRAEAAERDRAYKAKQLNTARWLWFQRRPIIRSTAET